MNLVYIFTVVYALSLTWQMLIPFSVCLYLATKGYLLIILYLAVWFCRQKRSAGKYLKINRCICSKKYVWDNLKYLRHIFDYLPCIFNLLREVFYHTKKIFFSYETDLIQIHPRPILRGFASVHTEFTSKYLKYTFPTLQNYNNKKIIVRKTILIWMKIKEIISPKLL